MKENIIAVKSEAYAKRIVLLYRYLTDKKKEFILSRQILRSGTSIGANVREAIYAQSRRDFISKMNIALKESAETDYWLTMLLTGKFISQIQYNSLRSDCDEITRILVKIIDTSKTNNS